jgi:carbon monoxide dehydrogenase subunit G
VHLTESVTVPARPTTVFALVDDLAAYPAWMPLVHAATPLDEAAWTVELRARVGPFARSKQLRMIRTERVADRLAVFERAEIDGRDHARWVLRVELAPVALGTEVTMHLSYDGRLWTGGILERVLDDEIRRGRTGLRDLVTGT